MPDPTQTSLTRFEPSDILAWLCDSLSPAQQRSVLRAMIAHAEALLEPGIAPSRTGTRILEMTTREGVSFAFAVGVQVQDRQTLQAVQHGMSSGSLGVQPAIWLDATGETPVVHAGAVCRIAGRTVATLVAGPEHVKIEIASRVFDRTLDLNEIDA